MELIESTPRRMGGSKVSQMVIVHSADPNKVILRSVDPDNVLSTPRRMGGAKISPKWSSCTARIPTK